MKNSVDLQIEVPNDSERQAILQSMRVEMKEQMNSRATVQISEEGTTIRVLATATDLVALRAIMNSTLRLIKTITEVAHSLT